MSPSDSSRPTSKPRSHSRHHQRERSPSTRSETSMLEYRSSHFYSYHCACSQLLFVTTTPIDKLARRRRAHGLDRAYILPLPPLPDTAGDDVDTDGNGDDDTKTAATASTEIDDTRNNDQGDISAKDKEKNTKRQSDAPSSTSNSPAHFAFSLTYEETIPQVVIRQDGFEKRYWARCQRCNIIVAYYLDWIHFQPAASDSSTEAINLNDDDGTDAVPSEGPHTRILYVIPGSLSSTRDMIKGRQSDREAWTVMDGKAVANVKSSR